ncbi:hypothetical protein GIB67_024900 [Kingdonia uniflora]|uniref:protoporphyrinogen oxidase n=1 Tax=Kingdonia uniflora TaxID=39325 RepID=A0A7J7NZC2_9MAGN|nr:hypothetical protein GIB67_024900 [Kingdonia uniflora]
MARHFCRRRLENADRTGGTSFVIKSHMNITCCVGYDSVRASDPEEAEAASVIRGMEAAHRLGMDKILILIDCQRLVHVFRDRPKDLSWGALTLAPDIRALASHFRDFILDYVDRRCNIHLKITKDNITSHLSISLFSAMATTPINFQPLTIRHGFSLLKPSNSFLKPLTFPLSTQIKLSRARFRCSIAKESPISPVNVEGSESKGYSVDCVVVGGGISGLCIAQALVTKHGDSVGEVMVTEARDRVGGNIITVERDGFLWEEGPNSFQPSDPMLTMAEDGYDYDSEDERRPQPRRHGRGIDIDSLAKAIAEQTHDVHLKVPEFDGKSDVDAFIEWLDKVEQKRDCSAFAKKVGLIVDGMRESVIATVQRVLQDEEKDEMHTTFVDSGLKDDLVFGDPDAPRFVLWNGKLRPVPSKPTDLPFFDLMSFTGKLRAGFGAIGVRPSPPVCPHHLSLHAYEESVEEFVRRNLGNEVFERLIEPFCSGVYAGDPAKLSMKAAFGRVWNLEQSGGSIISGAFKAIQERKNNPKPPRDPRLPKPKGQTVGSFRKGLSMLPDAISKRLGSKVKLSWKLSSIRKLDSEGYTLTYETPDGLISVQAKSVVITVPSHIANSLIRPLSRDVLFLMFQPIRQWGDKKKNKHTLEERESMEVMKCAEYAEFKGLLGEEGEKEGDEAGEFADKIENFSKENQLVNGFYKSHNAISCCQSPLYEYACPGNALAGDFSTLAKHCTNAAAEVLTKFYYPPVAAVSVSYPMDAIRKECLIDGELKGFGQLIPRSQGVETLGTIYSSALFPNRAPPGRVLLLNYIGGATNTGILSKTDSELVEAVDRDLRKILINPNAKEPLALGVRVWPQAIPQFLIGHLDLLESAKSALRDGGFEGLFLGGNYVTGVALGRCVEGAYESAAEVSKYLSVYSLVL